MEIGPPGVAGPSTFRLTPALGVTYVLDTEEDEIQPMMPLPPGVDDINDKDYDPLEDQDIDEDDYEERFPYPTPSSVVHGKRKATEVYDVDEEEPYRLRGKKTRLESTRKELECIYISSDSEGDVVQISEAPEQQQKKKRRGRPPKVPKRPVAPLSEPERKQASRGSPDEKSASPEAEMGSVERVRPKTPNSLRTQFAQVRKEDPSADLEICYHYSLDGDVWTVKCHTCTTKTEKKILSTGPGQSLAHLRKHLKGRLHQVALALGKPGHGAGPASSNDARKAKPAPRREQASPQPVPDHVAARPAAPFTRREKAPAPQDGGDDVERFLDQIGLSDSSVDLAQKLRAFGIGSDKRMNQIGALSDEGLGVLLDRLTERAGVDMATAILIREGLRRRAGML